MFLHALLKQVVNGHQDLSVFSRPFHFLGGFVFTLSHQSGLSVIDLLELLLLNCDFVIEGHLLHGEQLLLVDDLVADGF